MPLVPGKPAWLAVAGPECDPGWVENRFDPVSYLAAVQAIAGWPRSLAGWVWVWVLAASSKGHTIHLLSVHPSTSKH